MMALALAFTILIVNIFVVQVLMGHYLQEKAISQWTRNLEVTPTRGSITDRNGNELAKTVTSYTVLLRPELIKSADNAEKIADKLSVILEMDRDTIYEKATSNKSELWLKRQITNQQYEDIKALNLKGVAFTVDAKRYYVFGDFLTQMLGFTSVDGEGISGIESIYNEYLAGQPGKIVSETDKDGRPIPYTQAEVEDPVEGYDVNLSIDYAIQSFLEKALVDAAAAYDAASASGIVMNPKTGEILAISTKPSYDLNNIPRDDSDLLTELSRNKIITDTYEMGSVMKTVTMSAALEEGVVSMSDKFTCTGSKVINGEKISCHKTSGHGTQTLSQALANSCNPAFMEIGLRLGKEKLYDYYELLGFRQKTGINFPGESSSIFLNIDRVRDADLARISFGHAVSVTPIQFISAFNSIVNGGTLYTPYYVNQVVTQEGEIVEENKPKQVRTTISQSTSEKMVEMLNKAIAKENNAYIPGYRVGGKTATAQKYEDGKIAEGKYITSFVGVAPCDDPEIVCLIMVDEPKSVAQVYGSTIAAPVAKVVMEDTLRYLNVTPQYSEGEASQKVKVPNVVGKSVSAAQSELSKVGLKAQVVGEGTVTSQYPLAETEILKGSYVTVYTKTSSDTE